MSSTTIASALAMLCVAAQDGAPAAPDAPTPIAAFARHPRIREARISPGGRYLAVVSTESGRNVLSVTDLASGKVLPSRQPGGDAMVGSVRWVNDGRLVAGLVDRDPEIAAPVTRGELWAVDADGRDPRLIFGYRAGEPATRSRIRFAEKTREWGFFLSRDPDDRRRFLAETRSWDEVGDRPSRVVRLDAYTGARGPVATSPFLGAMYLTDEHGAARVTMAPTPQRELRVAVLDRGAYREVWEDPRLVESFPMGVAGEAGVLYVAGATSSGFGLFAVPFAGGEPRLLAHDAIVPPSGLVLDPRSHRVVAVEFEPDLPRWELVEPDHPLARMLAALEEAHPRSHVRVVETTDDGRRAVVKIYSDRDPGLLLVVDVAKGTSQPIGRVSPWLRPEDMARTDAFHLDASDGFRIHGYVTSPRGASRAAPPPLVVLTHGGPHGVRDAWGFDPDVQLLASRGYAVLQVNYRGSGGYGAAYQEAGYRHWGDRVVEDVVDAARWAVRSGYGDPGRVCAFGASFGGYAALQAAILAPDLFRCAVGYGGVYDLTRAGSTDEIRGSRILRGYDRVAMGEDEAELRHISPAHHADRLRAKVLLVHGRRDDTVPMEQLERMRDALERAGNPPELLVEPLEGHAFYDEAARARFYERLLTFLGAHDGPAAARPEAAPEPSAATSLARDGDGGGVERP